jgi:hypothetical protein
MMEEGRRFIRKAGKQEKRKKIRKRIRGTTKTNLDFVFLISAFLPS